MSEDNAKNVLDPGTVESRGFAGGEERDQVAEEIEGFLKESILGIKSEVRSFLNIFVFVTALPCPSHWAEIHPGYLMKGMCHFPVVGSIVGMLVSQVFDFALLLWELPVVVAATLSTAVSLKITGCLHEDGLADTSDGFGGGWTKQQILRIMSDSRLGTFGSAALILYLFAKIQLLAALGVSKWELGSVVSTDNEQSVGAGPALVVAHVLGRWLAPYLIWRCDYIEEDGPKSNFYSFMIRAKFLVSIPRLLFSLLFSYSVTAILYGPVLSIKLIISLWVFGEFAGAYARRKLGGVMGDFLGGTICLAELFVYTILAGGSILDTVQQLVEILIDSAKPSSEKLEAILLDDKLYHLVRFVAMCFVYHLWCAFVGYVEKKHAERKKEKDASKVA